MAQILMLKPAHYFAIADDIIDVHAKTLGAHATLVYVALARFVNRRTGECWPSIGRLAHLLDMARNTVKAALRKLEAAGLIHIRRRRDPAGDATSHLYTLLDPSPGAVEQRLTARQIAAERGRSPADPPLPELGRPPADLSPVTSCPTGGSPADQEPSVSQPQQENQPDGAVCAGKEIPKASQGNPCPHPVDEHRHFGAMILCTHCWTMITMGDNTPTAGPEGGEAHADCAA